MLGQKYKTSRWGAGKYIIRTALENFITDVFPFFVFYLLLYGRELKPESVLNNLQVVQPACNYYQLLKKLNCVGLKSKYIYFLHWITITSILCTVCSKHLILFCSDLLPKKHIFVSKCLWLTCDASQLMVTFTVQQLQCDSFLEAFKTLTSDLILCFFVLIQTSFTVIHSAMLSSLTASFLFSLCMQPELRSFAWTSLTFYKVRCQDSNIH